VVNEVVLNIILDKPLLVQTQKFWIDEISIARRAYSIVEQIVSQHTIPRRG
jgi:hypothetical protein